MSEPSPDNLKVKPKRKRVTKQNTIPQSPPPQHTVSALSLLMVAHNETCKQLCEHAALSDYYAPVLLMSRGLIQEKDVNPEVRMKLALRYGCDPQFISMLIDIDLVKWLITQIQGSGYGFTPRAENVKKEAK
jgi:hypothetical protein